LLELDPDLIRQLLLGHRDHPATVTDALAHMGVNRMLHFFSSLCAMRTWRTTTQLDKQILRQTCALDAVTMFFWIAPQDSRKTCPFGYVQLYR
jgi:hypothetical protein